jgi:NAD(P)H-hydrate epimerase
MMENAGSRAAEFILSKAPLGDFAISFGTSGDLSKAAEPNIALEKAVGEALKSPTILANGDVSVASETVLFAYSETLRDTDSHAAGKLAYIFCGKGNNGGDGFVVARLMCKAGWKVTVILVDGEPKTGDSITDFGLLIDLPVNVLDMKSDDRVLMKLKATPDLIVDAIYGTGFKGKLRGNGLKSAIYINKMGSLAREKISDAADAPAKNRTLIFALDIPSGLGGDLTRERELDKAAVRADYTVTFHAKKPVHLKTFAAEYCGEIVIADIGINEEELMHVEIYDEE